MEDIAELIANGSALRAVLLVGTGVGLAVRAQLSLSLEVRGTRGGVSGSRAKFKGDALAAVGQNAPQ